MCRRKTVLIGVIGLNIRRDDFYKKEISFQVLFLRSRKYMMNTKLKDLITLLVTFAGLKREILKQFLIQFQKRNLM